jgi:histidinol-phosphate aminotransferase
MNAFKPTVVPGIATLPAYIAGKPIQELQRETGVRDVIKLASNESPLGPSESACAAIAAELRSAGRYPDPSGFELRTAIARRLGVDREAICLGNGSNELLDTLVRTFVTAGDDVVCSQYCFIAFPMCAQSVGARVVAVPARDYGHDLDAMAAAVGERTRLIYVVNPNNPTGGWLDADALRRFLRRIPGSVLVVCDEAYFEYAHGTPGYPVDMPLWIDEFPNLVVLRTFSKAYGLAALRLGYAVAHPDCARWIDRCGQAFKVNALAMAAGLAALDDDVHLARAIATNASGLRQLHAALAGMGLACIPSVANFISVDLGRDAAPVYRALLDRGVIVRPIANYGLPMHLRISVGTEAENERLIAALAESLSTPPGETPSSTRRPIHGDDSRALVYRRHGDPREVLALEEVPLRSPGPLEARCAIIASPVNPADLLTIRGTYPALPPLPAVGGFESVARILEVGAGIDDLHPGQTAIVMGGTWQHEVVAGRERIIPLPHGVEPLPFATMIVNPTTALLLLDVHAHLQPGDWVLQNAANSAVGGYLVRIARQRGLRTINVVRRSGLEPALLALGADVVLIDGPELAARVLEATGGIAPKLALDGVAGAGGARLADCLGSGGVLVRYGAISGEDFTVDMDALEARGVRTMTFCLSTWRRSASAEARRHLIDTAIALTLDGTLRTPIAAIYPMARALDAVAHAMRDGRSGKILIAPNPALAGLDKDALAPG